MPLPDNLDPGTIEKAFERANTRYKGLEWELEGQQLLPQGKRPGPGQQPGRLQARLLSDGLRPGARTPAPGPGARDRRLQHGAPRDRPGASAGECHAQRVPPRGAGRTRSLDRRGLGGCLSRPASRGVWPVHVVAAVERRARAEHRMADRLRLRIAGCDEAHTRGLYLARRTGVPTIARSVSISTCSRDVRSKQNIA